ncbi:hypothetical protein BD410DRAFT_765411 [Rickenella mellea]|uniref:Uncharacterized protein n=1 Tax=Rickenella mellea TaxID=50990 RepID=A0A4Y7QEF1_9AGAM|nr:hypothetical protein BD410DRAFT_765411 [Rickenella mellea]
MFTPETPVLSVAIDAVSKLEGEDALCGLLTVFSKCKQSLQDGPRLENMCWRLWHRERTAGLPSCPSSPACSDAATLASHPTSPPFEASSDESDTSSDGEYSHRDGTVDTSHDGTNGSPSTSAASSKRRPPSTTASGGRRSFERSNVSFESTRDHSGPPSPASWHAPEARRPSLASRRTQSNSSVGKIMADLLPDKFIVSTAKNLPVNQREHWRESSSTLAGPEVPPVVVMHAADHPSTPPSRFPKVVIVNPTPHPTPPMTPQMPTDPHHTPTEMKQVQLATSDKLVVPARTSVPAASTSTAPKQLSQPGNNANGTTPIKPQERKFYFAQGESPDGESPDTSASSQIAQSVDAPKSQYSGESASRPHRGRKGKETRRSAGRPSIPRMRSNHRQPPMDSFAAVHKAVTNTTRRKDGLVGSYSSTGSKTAQNARRTISAGRLQTSFTGPSGAARSKASSAKVTPGRKKIEIATSSDFETTDNTDDESWSDETGEEMESRADDKEPDRLREAALEAQRQRDMFAKVPRRSYTELNRSKSGLLSSLFHPDPALFPLGHPYRHTRSSHDILAGLPSRQLYPTPGLQQSKAAVAVPVAAPVTAQASSPQNNSRSPLRLKGRPTNGDMEEESDDDKDNTIQVPNSLAMQRLAALDRDRRPPQPPQQQRPSRIQSRSQEEQNTIHERPQPQLMHVATAPIVLGYPYNMPTPIPPSTPRTTRRSMLANELSESLRRNLLWERQVSKQRPMGIQPRRQVGALTNGVRPLTNIRPGDPNPGPGPTTAENMEERRRKAIARNKSWADDYHAAGW